MGIPISLYTKLFILNRNYEDNKLCWSSYRQNMDFVNRLIAGDSVQLASRHTDMSTNVKPTV